MASVISAHRDLAISPAINLLYFNKLKQKMEFKSRQEYVDFCVSIYLTNPADLNLSLFKYKTSTKYPASPYDLFHYCSIITLVASMTPGANPKYSPLELSVLDIYKALAGTLKMQGKTNIRDEIYKALGDYVQWYIAFITHN